MKILGKFPSTRLRRVRNSDWVRRLISENNLSANDLILPIFLTEGKNKKCGFVVDLNIKRVVETSIVNYASIIKPKKHPRKACKYLFKERIINLNGDHYFQ